MNYPVYNSFQSDVDFLIFVNKSTAYREKVSSQTQFISTFRVVK